MKVQIAGRIDGKEIARVEWIKRARDWIGSPWFQSERKKKVGLAKSTSLWIGW